MDRTYLILTKNEPITIVCDTIHTQLSGTLVVTYANGVVAAIISPGEWVAAFLTTDTSEDK